MRPIDKDKLLDNFYSTRNKDHTWDYAHSLIINAPTIEQESQWILCSETADLPDYEVLCCDLRGNMLIGYLYTDENSDTGFGAEGDGECLVDCVAWREKPEPWWEGDAK